eukprot:symbB.v1.2.002556.t1/scaffold136.1/size304296/9
MGSPAVHTEPAARDVLARAGISKRNKSRPSAEVPSTPDAEVPADMAGTCRPRLLVMPSHYFEEKPQDDLPVMTSHISVPQYLGLNLED